MSLMVSLFTTLCWNQRQVCEPWFLQDELCQVPSRTDPPLQHFMRIDYLEFWLFLKEQVSVSKGLCLEGG